MPIVNSLRFAKIDEIKNKCNNKNKSRLTIQQSNNQETSDNEMEHMYVCMCMPRTYI